MTKIGISEARKELNSLPKRLEKEHEAIGITQKGRTVMAILDWNFYETIMESLEVLSDDNLLAQIKIGIKEISTGKGIDWEKAKKGAKPLSYKVIIAPTALRMLKDISDRRVRDILAGSIDELAVEPEKKGKPLTGHLKGFRSLRSVGQRYRIIYQVKDRTVEVIVVALGLRKEGDKNDIYLLMKKLIHHKLLE